MSKTTGLPLAWQCDRFPDGCRKTTRRPMPELCGISLAGSRRRPDRSNLTYAASLTMDVEDDETSLLKTIYLNNAKEALTNASASSIYMPCCNYLAERIKGDKKWETNLMI